MDEHINRHADGGRFHLKQKSVGIGSPVRERHGVELRTALGVECGVGRHSLVRSVDALWSHGRLKIARR